MFPVSLNVACAVVSTYAHAHVLWCPVVVHMVLLQQCQACSFYPVAFLDLRTYVLTCVCMWISTLHVATVL